MAAQRYEPKETDEDELISRAQRDEAAAFQELFERFYPMIHAFCYRICLDQAQAQDIAQETFIKAARSLHTYRRESAFKAWLYRIATNASRDWLRQKMRRNRLAEVIAEQWSEKSACVGPDHSRVAEALGALPEQLRLAVVLTFYEGMNHATAAKVLDCAEATVSWRVFRAKQKLRKLLSRKET